MPSKKKPASGKRAGTKPAPAIGKQNRSRPAPVRAKDGKSLGTAGLQKSPKVRYAVVGLGYFAQAAVLPAFAHAKNARLTALVSDDQEKLRKLARKYHVSNTYSYDQFQECLASKEVDAVYIALPNDLHKEYAIRAARMGVHVLCEKPMAVTERDCEEMIREAREHEVRLMVAYRLHFDPANLKAIEIANSGKLGQIRFLQSIFTMQVKEDNIRLRPERGGGSVYDIGVYCINAARNIFRAEPYEVFAFTASKDEPRFKDVEEMASVVMRFPGDRLASFTCSFGAADCASYRVFGTKGDLLMEPAFENAIPIRQKLTLGGKSRETAFPKRDQVAPELMYFADCVLKGKEPEPSGIEGLADIRVIRAVYESARTGNPVRLEPFEKKLRPSPDQAIVAPPLEEPDLFHAEAPTQD